MATSCRLICLVWIKLSYIRTRESKDQVTPLPGLQAVALLAARIPAARKKGLDAGYLVKLL